MRDTGTIGAADALGYAGFARMPGPFETVADAWDAVEPILATGGDIDAPLSLIGDFVLPPPGGPPSRDFQTLHLDFGLPVDPVAPASVGRFTALHIAPDTPPSRAATRLVPLRALLAGGAWPLPEELVRRLIAYGETHGAWEGAPGYVEGSLARIIEAVLGQELTLPSVKADPNFLCGTEFPTLAAELSFFEQRHLHLHLHEVAVYLEPGELLVFDNLSLAHGRRGIRQPGELHQRVYGHRDLAVQDQRLLRDGVLAAFSQ